MGGVAPIVFGLAAGVICYLAIQLKYRFGYDDSLDVVGVHMVGGLVGTLLIGLLADASALPAGDYVVGPAPDGLFFGGGADLLIDQAVAAAAALAYAFGMTFLLAKGIDAVIGLRVEADDEAQGLDRTQHAETAYNLLDA